LFNKEQKSEFPLADDRFVKFKGKNRAGAMTKRIVVTGASGYVGGRLVPRLLDEGYTVRCLVRSLRKLQDRAWAKRANLEIVEVDLENGETLTAQLDGGYAAYFLIHSMTSAGSEYAKRDLKLANTFANAAKSAALGRIIYLGGLGETGSGLSEHLSSRREVERALRATGVPLTVLRAAMIIGSGSASFEILRYLVERLPVMITPKWVSTPCQPIAIRNVIEYLVGVLPKESTKGKVFDIGGPEVLTYLEIMRIMAEELALPRRLVIPVPVLTPRLSSYWIHLVTPLGHDIARPLAEGLKNPVVCREETIREIIPQELLSVREAIIAARTRTKERKVETHWATAGKIAGDPDWAGGTVFRHIRDIDIQAPSWAVFRAVCMVGGEHGWYSANWLWIIRGWMDRIVGGPGLRRGRRDPESVAYGDALDFWRVVEVERNRSLVLRAEMKLPGAAWLEFHIKSIGGSASRLQQVARFLPRGLFGILYWHAVAPFHNIVFRGMLKGIERQALRLAQDPARVASESEITAESNPELTRSIDEKEPLNT
jgi:uncharacterized protein YbjT (DUF2867 family)